MNDTNEILYVDTQSGLESLCKELAESQWLALDTEFLRERTYYPKFCLLQISNSQVVACVDPLVIENLEPLLEIIYDPSITKVFHAARQDLEIFFILCGKIPAPVFDTQIAAPLLGYPESTGYAALVVDMLDITINKAFTRADWTRRPLTQDQLRYAADDVIYLGQLYQIMHKQLASLDRLDWLHEDFTALTEPDLYSNRASEAWRRIRAAQKLRGKQLSILQKLAAWREATASDKNMPRNWLIRDDVILDLARLQPEGIDELKHIRGLNERTIKRYGLTLCQVIADGMLQPSSPVENYPSSTKKTVEQEALIDSLTAIVRIRASKESLNSSILASRKELECLVKGQETKLLKGWRKNMIGIELLSFLDGNRSLCVTNGSLKIHQN